MKKRENLKTHIWIHRWINTYIHSDKHNNILVFCYKKIFYINTAAVNHTEGVKKIYWPISTIDINANCHKSSFQEITSREVVYVEINSFLHFGKLNSGGDFSVRWRVTEASLSSPRFPSANMMVSKCEWAFLHCDSNNTLREYCHPFVCGPVCVQWWLGSWMD